jgi:hypothetical protein
MMLSSEELTIHFMMNSERYRDVTLYLYDKVKEEVPLFLQNHEK